MTTHIEIKSAAKPTHKAPGVWFDEPAVMTPAEKRSWRFAQLQAVRARNKGHRKPKKGGRGK